MHSKDKVSRRKRTCETPSWLTEDKTAPVPAQPSQPVAPASSHAKAPNDAGDQDEYSDSYYSYSSDSSETPPKVLLSPTAQDTLFHQAKVIMHKAQEPKHQYC